MPELFVSTTSAIQGASDISIGNVIGSNICNLLFILGLSAIIHPVKFQKQTKWIENPMSIILSLIFLAICNINQDVSRVEGIVLIILFIAFLIYTVIMGKKSQDEVILELSLEESKKVSVVKNVGLILLGIIALTIVAIGTSLPELVTSVTAAIKGDSDIAIGNIIGSNIFNMLLIVGVSAIIQPISYNITYNFQMMILFVAMGLMLAFPFIKPKDEMSRANGMILVLLYIFYMVILFLEK